MEIEDRLHESLSQNEQLELRVKELEQLLQQAAEAGHSLAQRNSVLEREIDERKVEEVRSRLESKRTRLSPSPEGRVQPQSSTQSIQSEISVRDTGEFRAGRDRSPSVEHTISTASDKSPGGNSLQSRIKLKKGSILALGNMMSLSGHGEGSGDGAEIYELMCQNEELTRLVESLRKEKFDLEKTIEDMPTSTAELGDLSADAFDRRLRELFDACDVDGDEQLNKRELISMCSSDKHFAELLGLPERLKSASCSTAELEQWFNGLDVHGDGLVSWTEFHAWVERKRLEESPEQIRRRAEKTRIMRSVLDRVKIERLQRETESGKDASFKLETELKELTDRHEKGKQELVSLRTRLAMAQIESEQRKTALKEVTDSLQSERDNSAQAKEQVQHYKDLYEEQLRKRGEMAAQGYHKKSVVSTDSSRYKIPDRVEDVAIEDDSEPASSGFHARRQRSKMVTHNLASQLNVDVDIDDDESEDGDKESEHDSKDARISELEASLAEEQQSRLNERRDYELRLQALHTREADLQKTVAQLEAGAQKENGEDTAPVELKAELERRLHRTEQDEQQLHDDLCHVFAELHAGLAQPSADERIGDLTEGGDEKQNPKDLNRLRLKKQMQWKAEQLREAQHRCRQLVIQALAPSRPPEGDLVQEQGGAVAMHSRIKALQDVCLVKLLEELQEDTAKLRQEGARARGLELECTWLRRRVEELTADEFEEEEQSLWTRFVNQYRQTSSFCCSRPEPVMCNRDRSLSPAPSADAAAGSSPGTLARRSHDKEKRKHSDWQSSGAFSALSKLQMPSSAASPEDKAESAAGTSSALPKLSAASLEEGTSCSKAASDDRQAQLEDMTLSNDLTAEIRCIPLYGIHVPDKVPPTKLSELGSQFTKLDGEEWLPISGHDWVIIDVKPEHNGEPLELKPDLELRPGYRVTFLSPAKGTVRGYLPFGAEWRGNNKAVLNLTVGSDLRVKSVICRTDYVQKSSSGRICIAGENRYTLLEGSKLIAKETSHDKENLRDILEYTFEYPTLDRVAQNFGVPHRADGTYTLDVLRFNFPTDKHRYRRLGLKGEGVPGLDVRAKYGINILGVIHTEGTSPRVTWSPPPTEQVTVGEMCVAAPLEESTRKFKDLSEAFGGHARITVTPNQR